MSDTPRPVPLRFDLSSLAPCSVATLYSHLVTRPTGRALRLGIESQLGELGALCLSVLDFSQVVVLDYSCADEAVAKLIQRFLGEDRPSDVYFVARGVAERHREPIDEVLRRHGLALVAEWAEGGTGLLGELSALEQAAWEALERLRRGMPGDVAAQLPAPLDAVSAALASLAGRRVVAGGARGGAYHALTSILAAAPGA